jgi:hypothetical protein
VFRALYNRGLLTPSGSVRFELFSDEFFRHYGFLHQHPEFAAAISTKGTNFFQGACGAPVHGDHQRATDGIARHALLQPSKGVVLSQQSRLLIAAE